MNVHPVWILCMCFVHILAEVKKVPPIKRADEADILEEAFAQAGISLGPTPPPLNSAKRSLFSPLSRLSSKLSRLPFLASRSLFAKKLLKSKPLKFDGEINPMNMFLPNYPYPPHIFFPSINSINKLYPNNLWPQQQSQHQLGERKAIPVNPSMKTSASSGVEPLLTAPLPPPPFSYNSIAPSKGGSTSLPSGSRKLPRTHDPLGTKTGLEYGFRPMTEWTPSGSNTNSGGGGGVVSASVSTEDPPLSQTSLSKRYSGKLSFKKTKTTFEKQISREKSLFFPSKIVANKKSVLPVNPSDLLHHISKEDLDNNNETHSGDPGADCKNKDLGWCDFSEQYPSIYVRSVTKQCADLLDRMYVEVPKNLADFDEFVPFAPNANSTGHSSSHGSDLENNDDTRRVSEVSWSWAGYRSKNKRFCDSERKLIRPSIAQDINGRWFLIVQTRLYHQQVPVEVCRNPGGVCNHIGKCGKHARCVQKFNTQLLISIDLDKEDDCPRMKLFRLPSGCVCDSAQQEKD